MALAYAYSLGIASRIRCEVSSRRLVIPALVPDVRDRVHILRALTSLTRHHARLELTDIIITEDVLESTRTLPLKPKLGSIA